VKVHFDVSYCEQKDPLQLADVYMPAAGDMEHQPRFPAILAIHGGAWISGDKRFDALHCRKMAQKGYVVMAINYRLAPKHKHPAQIDDCREALRWLNEHAQEYHIDPEKLGVWRSFSGADGDGSSRGRSSDSRVRRRWSTVRLRNDPRGLASLGRIPWRNSQGFERCLFEGIAD
jgi:hypothetical protein